MLHGPQREKFNLRFELPSECARSLERGSVDVGLVPVIEMFRQHLEPVSDVCISSDGPVRSIFLLHRGPLTAIRSVAFDSSSRTSAALAKILLRERYGVTPKPHESAPDLQAMMSNSDAALLIGDPALRIDPAACAFEVLDLGQEWLSLTGLPMVYAVWAGRNIAPFAAGVFRESYEYGRTRILDIVRDEAAPRGVPPELAYRYLTEHIRFDLTPRASQGLKEFKRLARDHSMV